MLANLLGDLSWTTSLVFGGLIIGIMILYGQKKGNEHEVYKIDYEEVWKI